MFAVSRKPISTTGKFAIKNDSKDAKPKLEEDSQKSQGEPSSRKIFENSNSTIYSPLSLASKESTAVPYSGEKKEIKRIKFRLSTIKDVPYSQKAGMSLPESHAEKKSLKKTKEMKLKHKRINREGNFNCGRWQPEEHERFIEAIMRYGNEWKSVQKHVGTRSSTQARSHAQKFFVKIKKTNLLDFNMDLSKNSIKTLHEIANSMNAEEYCNAVKTLNCVAFERKNNPKRRHKKEETFNDSSDIFAETPNSLNIKYVFLTFNFTKFSKIFPHYFEIFFKINQKFLTHFTQFTQI
jgi:SHAQKYF class myb-like DNA-binding protein